MTKTIASGSFYVQMAMTGPRGMLPFPAGEYSANTPYTATTNVAPYVLLSGTYYVMNKVGTWLGTSIGKTPAQDYATNGVDATWIPFENYKAIYVELLMARMGLIGKAVFYDEYMFSQHGTDDAGNPSENYQDFEKGTFIPNILLNFLTGESEFGAGKFRGEVMADSGKIGGFNITSSTIGSKDEGDSMWLSKDGVSFQNSDREARIGLCMPPSSGTSNVVAGVFSTKLDAYDYQYGGIATLMVDTSGGTFGSALSIRTDNRNKDVAIDFKGRINTNGKSKYGNDYGDLGLTGIFVVNGVWYNNTWAKTSFHFVDGILVRVIYNTPH